MKIQIPPKIRGEDFNTEYRELIDKLAGGLNQFMDEVYQALDGRLDFINLNRQISTIDVTLNSSGQLVNPPQIKMGLKSKVQGILVLSATNLVNSSIYPVSAPFVSYTFNDKILTILNITGLQAGSQYRLTLELIG